MINIWLLVISIHFIRVIALTIFMSLLLIPRRRDLGALVCLQPHRMPSGKRHVPLTRVVSDFRLLYLVYYYRYRRKQGYPTLHHHKVAKRT